MYCIDFPAYVFCGRFHCEVGVKGETQIFECGRSLFGEVDFESRFFSFGKSALWKYKKNILEIDKVRGNLFAACRT